VLVEGNVFRGNTSEALSTYGLVIPMDSPNTSPDGDYELDGFANLGASKSSSFESGERGEEALRHVLTKVVENDWGPAKINITQVGNFTKAPYGYSLTPLEQVQQVVLAGAGLGKI
jgi:pectate lyase